MKKFLLCMFAGMLFVPTLAGCGQSPEATIPEDTGTQEISDAEDMSEQAYEDAINNDTENP